MSRIHVSTSASGLSKVDYRPPYIYETRDGRQSSIPASVYVQFEGDDLRLGLDIADAEALMFGLAVAMVEHAAALRGSNALPKVVA